MGQQLEEGVPSRMLSSPVTSEPTAEDCTTGARLSSCRRLRVFLWKLHGLQTSAWTPYKHGSADISNLSQTGRATSDKGTSCPVALSRMAEVCRTAPTVCPSGYGEGRK